MNDDWDKLLAAGLLSVPDDFAERVLREINRLPQPEPQKTWPQRLQWLAAIGAAVFGAVELISFIFGIWIAGTAY